jgi:hypothetical protein
MAALADELREHATAILDELMHRAPQELKGTLYDEMNKQKILRARYANVLEVITDYVQTQDVALFRQHHIIIFMQRYYLDIDAGNPLTPRLINWRTREIERSVNMYLEVLKQFTSPKYHTQLETIFGSVRLLIHQMGTFLLVNIDKLKDRIPRVKMAGIQSGPDSTFDIYPKHGPRFGSQT